MNRADTIPFNCWSMHEDRWRLNAIIRLSITLGLTVEYTLH